MEKADKPLEFRFLDKSIRTSPGDILAVDRNFLETAARNVVVLNHWLASSENVWGAWVVGPRLRVTE